jgi:hypothetical protein
MKKMIEFDCRVVPLKLISSRPADQVLVVAIGLLIGPLRGTSVGEFAPVEPA